MKENKLYTYIVYKTNFMEVAEATKDKTEAVVQPEAEQAEQPQPPIEEQNEEPEGESEGKITDGILNTSGESTAEETSAEGAEEAAETDAAEAETEEGKSGVLTLVSGLFPDREIGSEEDATQALTEFVAEAREYREKQEGATKRLASMFRDNPDLLDLIHLMDDGATLSEALPYVVGEDADEEALEAAKEGWKKTAAEKRKAKAEKEKALKETSKNLEISIQNIRAFAQENNMTDDEAGEFLDAVDDIMSNISKGNITGEILTKLMKGMKYDKAVADTAEKAEVKGRNEAIKEVKAKKAEKVGDGLPKLKSAATEKPDNSDDPDSPADLLGRSIDSWTDGRRF